MNVSGASMQARGSGLTLIPGCATPPAWQFSRPFVASLAGTSGADVGLREKESNFRCSGL